MQTGEKDFDRAQSRRDLAHLGDPERWGGADHLVAHVQRAGVWRREGAQIIRAQCADLIARAWELTAVWTLKGLTAGDVPEFYLDVTIGSGQSTSVGRLSLLPAIIAPVPSHWVVTATGGTLSLPQPLPAVALAVRGLLIVTNAGGDPDHNVDGDVSVVVAPRAMT